MCCPPSKNRIPDGDDTEATGPKPALTPRNFHHFRCLPEPCRVPPYARGRGGNTAMDNWDPRPLDPGQITLHRRGKGKPLVLLHCLGQSWRFWDVLDPLMDRNELFAYSFPGHHDTPPPGHQYGAPELTEQLHAVA